MIDWRWLSSGYEIEVAYLDAKGERGTVRLEREPGEPWGLTFDGVLFDGVKTCINSCTFCFMRQLPQGMRPSLYLRDDDFRLSFLQGTFITCTNIGAQDEARIVEQHLSPLRVSLHAVSPEARNALIGNRSSHGLEVCKRLLAAGIEMHLQVVLVPGANDGEELRRTLEWAYAYPGVLSVGVVPLGFTKHQGGFCASYNDPEDARAVLAALLPFQERALAERGNPWAFAADEFYRNAFGARLLENLPPSSFYGGFDLYEDGIGIIRSFVDSWQESADAAARLAERLRGAQATVHCVAGCAQREYLEPLLAESPLRGLLVPFPVKNSFFGGNVDVTGLLTGADILAALNVASHAGEAIRLAVLPAVIFNDDGLTLDDMSLEDMQNGSDVRLAVVSCNPSGFLEEIAGLIP
ncbi:MAG: DUF512 domain-containing protein [Eggerthellaceae bacterium]|nr:DUF512 domain-containing protein [Eggerthellaceae bacterium]